MTDTPKKKLTLNPGAKPTGRGDRAPVRGINTPKKRPTLAEAQADRERRERREANDRPPRRDGGSFGDRPPRRDGGSFGDRPPRREGGNFGDRPPRRDGGSFGDRPPRREGGSFGDRPPRREGGSFGDRPPRRDGGSFGDRPPRRDGGGFGDRPPRRDGGGFGDRPPRRDGGSFGDRPPRRDGGSFGDRPQRPEGERPQRHGGFEERAPRPEREAPVRTNTNEDGERLSKVMADRGLASRREADEWIGAGYVLVNGAVAVLGQRIPADAQIDIDPRAKELQAQRVTILLHKPIGVVSGQPEDGYEPAVSLVTAANRWADDPTAKGLNFNPNHLRGLAPAGRLDIDSTGLLVFTQDGRVAKHLIGDDSDVEKEYLVRVALPGAEEGSHPMHALPEHQLALLNHGLELDGVQLREAKVSWANEDQLRFVLREGRKRQIRRMCEAVGLQVLALKRVRIGRIPLSHLPMGQWRYLAPWERF
ncbi:MAG: pseudouridine synthase [Inhella sp.]|uniref:pseudouridine synthase n=1 Tax=Inhella sp. TaxID=1921806 RepID=UPI003919F963